MTLAQLMQIAVSAAREVVERDYALFAADVHEQAVTHRLAFYLEPHVPGWDVDCEYNRKGAIVKRLPAKLEYLPEIADDQGERIKPDIVVHKRMERKNLLVIEVKKDTNNDVANDDWKLRGMTSQVGPYGYELGIHVIFNCDPPGIDKLTCYRDGEPDAALTAEINSL